jgi:4-diphosphocytidyl-2-C-methyl-D-erythritol kinase
MLCTTLSLADAVEVSDAPSLALEVEGPPEIPRDSRNLAVVAARCLAAEAGVEPRARIRIVKRVPAAAGLGGGSSDAAAALRLLRDLWCLDVDDGRLAAVGAAVGADVPFCLAAAAGAGAAVVEGVGEKIDPFAPGAVLAVVVANLGFPLATPAVFAAWDEQRRPGTGELGTGGPARVRRLRDAWAAGRVGDLAAGLFNDLEPAAIALRPDLRRLADAVRGAGVVGATMTGSGPTWIGIAHDAEEAAARLRAAGVAFAVAATAPASMT